MTGGYALSVRWKSTFKYIKQSSPFSSRGSFLTFLFYTIYYTAEVLRSFPSPIPLPPISHSSPTVCLLPVHIQLSPLHSSASKLPICASYSLDIGCIYFDLLIGFWFILFYKLLPSAFFCFYILLGTLYSVLFSLACLFQSSLLLSITWICSCWQDIKSLGKKKKNFIGVFFSFLYIVHKRWPDQFFIFCDIPGLCQWW